MAKKVVVSQKPTVKNIKDTETFGKFIKHKRTTAGLSIEEAANLCNINYRTLDKLEKGAEGTRLSTALYVAKMFGLKIGVE